MKYKEKNPKIKGFTLIELLIVIAIIGILSSAIMIDISGARNKAKIAKSKSDLNSISNDIQTAEVQKGMLLGEVTGNWCSACACSVGSDLRNITGTCYNTWATSLSNIETKLGATSDQKASVVATYGRDPWGSPYILDENEGEPGYGPCRIDVLRSVGPDGISGTSDDIVIKLPLVRCITGV